MHSLTLPFTNTTLAADDECVDTIVQACDGNDYIVWKNKSGIHEWILYGKHDEEEIFDAQVFVTLRAQEPAPEEKKKRHVRKTAKPTQRVDNDLEPAAKRGRGRPRKNPDGPVRKPRQPTAYNLFLKDTLPRLKDSHPHLSNKERMTLASEMWNAHKAEMS